MTERFIALCQGLAQDGYHNHQQVSSHYLCWLHRARPRVGLYDQLVRRCHRHLDENAKHWRLLD